MDKPSLFKRIKTWWMTPPVDNADQDLADQDEPFPEPVELELTDVFDLHTIPPKQIKAVVEEYLFQVHVRGFPVVRLIHGKGSGVQRELVRKILSRTPFVREYHDAPDASSWGATIAYLPVEPDVSDSNKARLE